MNNTNTNVENEEVATKKAMEQAKLEGVAERLRKFLADEGVALIPKISYRDAGIIADIEMRLLTDEPVRNIYDESNTGSNESGNAGVGVGTGNDGNHVADGAETTEA